MNIFFNIVLFNLTLYFTEVQYFISHTILYIVLKLPICIEFYSYLINLDVHDLKLGIKFQTRSVQMCTY
uniref:Uncharacterized protein n=1 Tax=Kalanchoe fedtschenkoi TaxID=63787 RepID=A0A7N1A0E6_KALFE